MLESFFTGRSGQLENTVFVMLAPDGKTKLARSGRSPQFVFGDAERLAEFMGEMAQRYSGDAGAKAGGLVLPELADLRLALNVAACDGRPLVVAQAPDAEAAAALERRLAELAWADDLAGRLLFVMADEGDDLATVIGREADHGVWVLQPDAFGRDGKVLAQASADAEVEALAATLKKALAKFQPMEKDRRQHINEARRQGVEWKSKIPVTDPEARLGGAEPRRGRRR